MGPPFYSWNKSFLFLSNQAGLLKTCSEGNTSGSLNLFVKLGVVSPMSIQKFVPARWLINMSSRRLSQAYLSVRWPESAPWTSVSNSHRVPWNLKKVATVPSLSQTKRYLPCSAALCASWLIALMLLVSQLLKSRFVRLLAGAGWSFICSA